MNNDLNLPAQFGQEFTALQNSSKRKARGLWTNARTKNTWKAKQRRFASNDKHLKVLAQAQNLKNTNQFGLNLPYLIKNLKTEAKKIENIWLHRSDKEKQSVSDSRYMMHVEKVKVDPFAKRTSYRAKYLKALPEGQEGPEESSGTFKYEYSDFDNTTISDENREHFLFLTFREEDSSMSFYIQSQALFNNFEKQFSDAFARDELAPLLNKFISHTGFNFEELSEVLGQDLKSVKIGLQANISSGDQIGLVLFRKSDDSLSLMLEMPGKDNLTWTLEEK